MKEMLEIAYRAEKERTQVLELDGSFTRNWQMIVMLLLLYTAIITPYELAYLDPRPDWILFWVNRLVDVLFIIDIFINFNTCTQLSSGEVARTRRTIRPAYLRSWFPIDLVSTIPYDLLVQDSSSSSSSVMPFLRTLKLLKLVARLK